MCFKIYIQNTIYQIIMGVYLNNLLMPISRVYNCDLHDILFSVTFVNS